MTISERVALLRAGYSRSEIAEMIDAEQKQEEQKPEEQKPEEQKPEENKPEKNSVESGVDKDPTIEAIDNLRFAIENLLQAQAVSDPPKKMTAAEASAVGVFGNRKEK